MRLVGQQLRAIDRAAAIGGFACVVLSTLDFTGGDTECDGDPAGRDGLRFGFCEQTKGQIDCRLELVEAEIGDDRAGK